LISNKDDGLDVVGHSHDPDGLPLADLSGVNLNGARLGGASIIQTDLTGASLAGANLNAANLRNSNLSGVDLTGADLSGANFSNTKLCGANLAGAVVHGCNFENAELASAQLDDVDLGQANLDGAKLVRDLSELDLDVRTVLHEHATWIASFGSQGQRADLNGSTSTTSISAAST
jgi:uncharacterized protein YjbI with pentapeptide repeats